MALFQKKITPITAPKYTLGHQDIKLIVGLGNVGDQYSLTRHNAGFMAVDAFASSEDFNDWVHKKDLKSLLCAKIIDGKKVILCKPTTFMNLSGEAVRSVQNFYKISDHDTLVIYDELDIDFGTLRTCRGGSSAGHNGIKSLIQHTDNDWWRVRIGVGPKQPKEIDSADFVLQTFKKTELEQMKQITLEAHQLIYAWLAGREQTTTIKL